MALTKNITLLNNFGENSSFDNAYIRVDRVESTKFLCTASIGYYKENGLQFLMGTTVSFSPSLDSGNYIKQTYEHLKTLPEFADATDC